MMNHSIKRNWFHNIWSIYRHMKQLRNNQLLTESETWNVHAAYYTHAHTHTLTTE